MAAVVLPGTPRSRPPPALTVIACAHCGLPVPAGRVAPQDSQQFCCDGCSSVHAVLSAAGLTDYYAHQISSDAALASPRPTLRKFEELDEPAFQTRHCQQLGDGLRSTELFLEGVHCSACVWLVERLGRVVPAVVNARFDLTRSVLQVTWNGEVAPLSAVARALDSLGYCPHPSGSTNVVAQQRKGDRALLLRLGVAGAAAGNVMLMALALYSGKPAGMSQEYLALFRWGSFLIATPTVFWTGSVFFRGALAALRTRTAHMDLPVSLGILAGYLGSASNTLRGHGDIYFDSLCTLIFLLLVGRYLQRTQQRRSAKASQLISALAPTTARLVEADRLREVPAGDVAVGAIVEVLPGERIAVDGVVTQGFSSVDASLLTGESLPQNVAVGDRVHAGTTNQSATLRVRVESAGAATRLGRLMHSVETTQRERAPIVRLADRVAGYFVVGIVFVALATLLFWWHFDAAHALDHTVALLVVTCPCALGMATPLAVSAALRQAAAAGVLFKGGEFIEELAQPGVMVFDKTGTLTEGRLDLVAWDGDESVKPLLRAAEATSGHPIARAVQRALTENELLCCDRTELPSGLRARVADQTVLMGSQAMIGAELGSLPLWALRSVRAHATLGRTPVVIAVENTVRAVAAFADRVRPDAATNLKRLHALGFELHVLSGDHQEVVAAVAAELGVPLRSAQGGASPESKLAFVAELRKRAKRVFMVGDGVNDAAAMAAANVGIAVHGGAEACLAAADVFTTRPGLEPVLLAAAGARRTVRVIRGGIVLSLAYNLVGIGLAVTGQLDPLLAAVLMPLSSITVVTLAMRATTFRHRSSS
ncbi:MAG: heavy metal translocating P-type ATPase [Pseudomonadota bacterium]